MPWTPLHASAFGLAFADLVMTAREDHTRLLEATVGSFSAVFAFFSMRWPFGSTHGNERSEFVGRLAIFGGLLLWLLIG